VADSLAMAAPAAVSPSDPLYFRFAVFSDIQVSKENRTMLARFAEDVAPNAIEFFAVTGDITEDATTQEFSDIKTGLDAVGIPYYVTLGNHDLFNSGSKGGWDVWKQTFGPATFSVTIANAVRLILLDTAAGELGKEQFQFLETELATRPAGSFAFVGTHYPLYDTQLSQLWCLPSVEERYRLGSMMDAYGTYAFFAGHIHGYRQLNVARVLHFLVGTMYPYELEFSEKGYVLFTYDHGAMTWERKTF